LWNWSVQYVSGSSFMTAIRARKRSNRAGVTVPPSLGTISNALVIGLSTDLFLAVMSRPDAMGVRISWLVAGIVLQGVATAAYIGAQFGRGPRDGLMTGLARRTGRSLRLVRTLMELSVFAIGLLLGGVAGLGTILYAVSIGPLSQALLPAFLVAPRDSDVSA